MYNTTKKRTQYAYFRKERTPSSFEESVQRQERREQEKNILLKEEGESREEQVQEVATPSSSQQTNDDPEELGVVFCGPSVLPAHSPSGCIICNHPGHSFGLCSHCTDRFMALLGPLRNRNASDSKRSR